MHPVGVLTLSLVSGLLAAGASAGEPAEPLRPWTNDRLHDPAAWPQGERITATAQGLRVEVAEGRTFNIGAASGLSVPAGPLDVRVRVAELGGGGKWFVRVYGEVRRAGDLRTISLAQDETTTGERIFHLDPRLIGLTGKSLQLQLGIEGAAGSFVVFSDVAILTRPARFPARTLFQPGQKDIAAVEWMPNLPEPYEATDWREKARAFDNLAFDFQARGEFLPLVWLEESPPNIAGPTFGLPSYVGAPDQGPGKPNSQEGITCMGAVLGATVAGLDKSQRGHDYVSMSEAWFNSKNGMNLVLNRQQDGGAGSF